MAQVVQILQDGTTMLLEGLPCLPAQSQEHGIDSRKWAYTLGELDRAIEVLNSSAGLISAPLCKEEQEEAYTLTYRRPMVWISLAKQSEIGFMKVSILQWALCSLPNRQVHHWRPVLVTDDSRLTLSTSDRHGRVWKSHGEHYAACNIVSDHQ